MDYRQKETGTRGKRGGRKRHNEIKEKEAERNMKAKRRKRYKDKYVHIYL